MTEDIDSEFVTVTSEYILIRRDDFLIASIYILGIALGWYIGRRFRHGA